MHSLCQYFFSYFFHKTIIADIIDMHRYMVYKRNIRRWSINPEMYRTVEISDWFYN